MKVFITGHKGFVGRELLKRGFLPLECNITNFQSVESKIQKVRPDLLLHLAGKSGVDYCEKKQNQDEIISINVRGTYNIFQVLNNLKLPGVLMSSDQVWGGGFFEKHKEDSKRTPPVNFYGMSKVSAEAVANSFGGNVIRTSYLFNTERMAIHLGRMSNGIKQDYPVFIQRSFLHLHDFCDMLELYCERFYKMPKVLHLSGSAVVSWYGFAKEIEKQFGFKDTVKPRFSEKQGFAPRPWFGGLNTNLAFRLGFPKRDYMDGIERMKHEG